MDQKPTTAYQRANQLAAQQLKPLREYVEKAERERKESKKAAQEKPRTST